MYDYYKYSEDGSDDGGTDTYLVPHGNDPSVQRDKGRALNRGRLKTDLLLPESAQKQEKEASSYKYGDRRILQIGGMSFANRRSCFQVLRIALTAPLRKCRPCNAAP